MASKKPRFFCDNCGAEVPLAAKSCPGCGRFFASVRCPACGFSAEEARFKSGCPVCGYSAPPGSSGNYREVPEKKKVGYALPLWVYVLTALAFIGVTLALWLTLFR